MHPIACIEFVELQLRLKKSHKMKTLLSKYKVMDQSLTCEARLVTRKSPNRVLVVTFNVGTF